MTPSCVVEVVHIQYGFVCTMHIWGVGVSLFLNACHLLMICNSIACNLGAIVLSWD